MPFLQYVTTVIHICIYPHISILYTYLFPYTNVYMCKYERTTCNIHFIANTHTHVFIKHLCVLPQQTQTNLQCPCARLHTFNFAISTGAVQTRWVLHSSKSRCHMSYVPLSQTLLVVRIGHSSSAHLIRYGVYHHGDK